MPTSQTQANLDLDASYGSGTPATLYACLATSRPNFVGDGTIVEPSTSTQYTTYAEVAITNDTSHFGPATGGVKHHLISFSFPAVAGGDAGCIITHVVFRSASAGGRIIDAIPLPSGTVIGPGVALTFPPGSLNIGEQ